MHYKQTSQIKTKLQNPYLSFGEVRIANKAILGEAIKKLSHPKPMIKFWNKWEQNGK